MRFSQLLFRLVHRNCLIFGTKVNLGNTYTLEIFIFFEQFLIPFIFFKRLNNSVFRLFFRLVQNCFHLKEKFPLLENLLWGKNLFFWFFLITIFRKFAERPSTTRLLVRRMLIRKNLEFSPRSSVRNAISQNLHIRIVWNLAVR